jgi:dienelactone hydrolase
MSQEIVLLHSALGRRPAIQQWATFLQAAGHRVHTPDIYDGEVFTRVEDGLRKRDALGIAEIVRRTRAAVADLPAQLVYMGWSLGAAGAELLAATRPGAKAAILLHGVVPLAALHTPSWPAAVSMQLHYAANDPFVSPASVRGLKAAVDSSAAEAEVYCYEGDLPHLFDDGALAGHSPEATALMRERVLALLERL